MCSVQQLWSQFRLELETYASRGEAPQRPKVLRSATRSAIERGSSACSVFSATCAKLQGEEGTFVRLNLPLRMASGQARIPDQPSCGLARLVDRKARSWSFCAGARCLHQSFSGLTQVWGPVSKRILRDGCMQAPSSQPSPTSQF